MPNTYQTMNTNTQIEKTDKVLSKISGKELKAFAHLYACSHDDFATALVEMYWKPERGNYKEMGETMFNGIKRMALLKEKTKEFAWLMAYIKSNMGFAVVDRTIKEGIKQLIAEYPDKFYFKSYLGSLL